MEASQGVKIDKNNNKKLQQRRVFDADELEARWMQMQTAGPSNEHSALLGIYERLLHRGALRTWPSPWPYLTWRSCTRPCPTFRNPWTRSSASWP